MKRFKIQAEIRYHVDIGEFDAPDQNAAILQAYDSRRYARVSDRSPGGIYDLVIFEVPTPPAAAPAAELLPAPGHEPHAGTPADPTCGTSVDSPR